MGDAAGGTPPYTYQWYSDMVTPCVPGAGTAIAGATSQNLYIDGLTADTTYYFVCRVTDTLTVEDDTAEIAVTTPVASSAQRPRATRYKLGYRLDSATER